MNARTSIRVFTSFLLLLASGSLTAEQMREFGDYEVHYSVVPTSFIPPATAASYGLTRGKNRLLLNIAVRRKTPADPLNETAAQAAVVSAQRHDLIRPYELEFTEIREEGAIYYLSDFAVLNEEFSRFSVQVQITAEPLFEFEFSKKLYADE